MNLKIICISIGILATELLAAQDQTTELSLEQVVKIARLESPDAQTARHSFRSAYWNYKYYRANYLPTLNLTSDPNLNRAINKITMGDSSVKFVEQNLLNTDLTKRIEPVRYQEAKKNYVETLELVSANAINKFFALATAQSNYDIASFNYANADTLYRYAQGRYNIGTITENEMLQLELNRLTEETNRMNARIEMDNCMQELRSYLGIQEEREIRVRVSSRIPNFSINLNEALALAYENSPDIQTMKRRKLESESAVARARANAGLKADIYLRFGLTQTADKLPEAYRNLLDQQYVSLSISLPILDWGRGKGQVRVARSNRDLVYTQVEQSRTDFELNVRKLVKQFNLQTQRVRIAARTDETAQRRNEVARKLYILGKSTILDLNASISEKDSARRNYVSALYNYWSLYYTLRSMTLYDFESNKLLTEDYNLLIE